MGRWRAPENEKARVSTQNTGAVTQDGRGANNIPAQTEACEGADRPTPGAGAFGSGHRDNSLGPVVLEAVNEVSLQKPIWLKDCWNPL